MLRLTNVQKDYPGFKLDVSMEVKPGRITGFVGPNGAGKSTTYKAILGLIKKDSGDIKIFGKDVANITVDDKENIGVALSDSGFSGYITVSDVVKILRASFKDFDEKFFLEKCNAFKIPMDKKIKDFSTGMKAKLKVLVAISHEANFLILDEPTSGLDVFARDETLNLLREYMAENEERAILISSHISTDLESLCDDIYFINDGKIVFHEDTDKLISEYALLKMTEDEFSMIDKKHIIRIKKEKFGISALTNQRKYYAENYPSIVMEKGSIDDAILLIIGGEKI